MNRFIKPPPGIAKQLIPDSSFSRSQGQFRTRVALKMDARSEPKGAMSCVSENGSPSFEAELKAAPFDISG
jgi:hypothetical protein